MEYEDGCFTAGSLLLGAGNIGLNLNWEDNFQLLNQLCTKLLQNDKKSTMSSVTTTATIATKEAYLISLDLSLHCLVISHSLLQLMTSEQLRVMALINVAGDIQKPRAHKNGRLE